MLTCLWDPEPHPPNPRLGEICLKDIRNRLRMGVWVEEFQVPHMGWNKGAEITCQNPPQA